MPDAKWLDAVKLPVPSTIGIALACGALLLLDAYEFIPLGQLSVYARPVVAIAGVAFAVLAVVRVVDLALSPLKERQKQSQLATRRAVHRKEQEQQRAEMEAKALAQLDYLSDHEVRRVAECLRAGSPSFYACVHSPPVTMLMGKGLVWTPGGEHHQDHYPFSIHDFVWRELIERKDELLKREKEIEQAEEAKKRKELEGWRRRAR